MNENYPEFQPFLPDSRSDLVQKRFQKREIRFIGSMLGLAVITYVVLGSVFTKAMATLKIYAAYSSDSVVQFSLDILFVLFGMLLPFFLFGKAIERRTRLPAAAPLSAPKDLKLSVLAVFFGLGLCMLGNIATSYIVLFSKFIGHEFTSPSLDYPSGAAGFFLSFMRIAVVAAICEELSFRGTSLQPLRKYGDWFAVLCSSAIFAIMHGNLVQAPFALIAGVGLGWICIKTGSIWPPIVVHILNNLFSLFISYLADSSVVSDELSLKIESVILYSLIGIGAICGFFFVKRAKALPSAYNYQQHLSGFQKAVAFFVNIPMILAVGYMLYVTALFIK